MRYTNLDRIKILISQLTNCTIKKCFLSCYFSIGLALEERRTSLPFKIAVCFRFIVSSSWQSRNEKGIVKGWRKGASGCCYIWRRAVVLNWGATEPLNDLNSRLINYVSIYLKFFTMGATKLSFGQERDRESEKVENYWAKRIKLNF